MRMSLLLMAASALLLSGLGNAASAATRDDSASEKLGLKLSLQCYTSRQLTFFETLDKAAAVGIKYVEMYGGQKLKPGSDEKVGKNMSDADCTEVQQKLAATGIKLVAYGVDSVAADEAGARKEFDWAKKMGIEVLVNETKPNAIHDKLCKEYNIRWAIHDHPKPSHYWNPDTVLADVKDCGPLVGSCADVGHWVRSGLNPIECLKKLQGRIEHLHFKDLNELAARAHDVPWGTGKSDAKGMLEETKRQGFKGYFSIEYEHGTVEELDRDLALCVAFFDRTMAELAK